MTRREVWLGAAALIVGAALAGIGSLAAGGVSQIGRAIKALASVAVATAAAWLAGPALARARR